MKAIILAGGKGSRLQPLTDNIPKALVPIGNSTLIETLMESLPDAVETVIITTKYLGSIIEEKLADKYLGKNILYAPQPVDSEGTWPALYCTKHFINEGEQFLVLNCDDIFEKEELSQIVLSKRNGMGVTTTTMPAKYHSIKISEEGFVLGLERHPNENREEPVQDTFSNGLYLLDTTVFSFPPVSLIDGEAGLPQTLLKHLETYPLFAHKMEHWQPCNSFEDLAKITAAI